MDLVAEGKTSEPGSAGNGVLPEKKVNLLGHRDFAVLWAGQGLSSVGNQMFPVILSIVVLDRHAGLAGLGAVLALQAGAFAIGSAFSASAADRWRRTRLMIFADTVRAAGIAAIAIAPTRMPEGIFIGLVAIIGFAEGLFLPAYSALLPRVLPARKLQSGNALTALTTYISMIVGPSLAGVLLAVAGLSSALWTDVATFAFSLGTLAVIREGHGADRQEKEGHGALRQMWRDAGEGVHAVWERPWIAASICSATIIMTFVVAPAYVAAPVVARERLGGTVAYGTIFAALGAGSVIGSVVGGKITSRHPGTVGICGLFTIVMAVGSLAALPLSLIVPCWAIAGAGVTIFQIMWTTALQKGIPDRLLGRVMALDQLGSQGLMPLGYFLAGAVAAAWGPRTMLLACAALVLPVASFPLLVPGGTTFSSTASETSRTGGLRQVEQRRQADP